ncbi:phage tail protein [Sulfurimonas sp.]|uniref:phage tail protein n=1 Tax=Sulfurimonas sp. TaxID=2022749 RepID=UPI0025FDBD1B|nr:phage tail protein [Sulfurimonas sp.]
MLAQIDEVVLEVDSNVEEILEKFNFNFTKINRVGNNPTYQKINGWEQEVSFSGHFVLKSLDELEPLKDVAKLGKPIWFIQKDSHFEVIITELSTRKKLFLKSGAFIKQGFDITLKRYFK